nr:type VI secretion system tip protein TssI/VgrG [Pseudenhygromyxa sp. WMMC2535]
MRCADGPENAWQVRSAHISEAIDEPYQIELELSSSAAIDLEALLGADAELVLLREGLETRHSYGVIARIDDLGGHDHRFHYALHLVPALALLDQGQNSRIFQHLSVQDIVKQVLDEALAPYGRSVDLGALSRGAAPREYCVQYRESDLDFVARLLEEEGIAYDFVHEHGAGVECMTLRDDNMQYAEFESLDGDAEVPLILDRADQASRESVVELGLARELTVTAILQRDFDWLSPADLLSEPRHEADARGRERRIYTHMRRRYLDDDLAERVGDQLAAARRHEAQLFGRGNVTGFTPGQRFELVHAPPELEGSYLITRLSHVFVSEGDGPARYHNEFHCIPAQTEYRPHRHTPKPRVHGPQTATVVGDDEIHTDEHGRIQVQFHWQETPSYDADASCWVRCAQPWAGLGWGVQFIPRVGMEVVVEFLEGNPDCPLVTGCVYNGDNPPPFSLPENKSQSGWRTNSTPGGGGYNMLRFEDAAGREQIHMHGQKDLDIVIENDKTSLVKHNEYIEIGNNRTKVVGHDETSSIVNDRKITVGNDHDEIIGANMTLGVGKNRTEIIGANQTLSVAQNQTETVGASRTEAITQAATQTVGEGKTVLVGEAYSLTVGEAMTTTVGGESSETVAEDKTVQAKNIRESAAEDKQLSTGGKFGLSAEKEIAVVGNKTAQITIEDELVVACGDASITLKKDGTIAISGKKISIDGSGDINIKSKKNVNTKAKKVNQN